MFSTSDAKLQSVLGKIDECRTILNATQDGGSETKEALNSIPQVVVVGQQSSGKSTVLSLLGKFKFPTSKERCTRVATVLQFRRTTMESESISVVLTGITNGKASNGEVTFDIKRGSEDDAIRKAQARAIQETIQRNPSSGIDEGDVFADKHEVKILLQKQNIPNLTLVDLPGLIAKEMNTVIHQTIEDVVRRYCSQSGSLILNVIPVNIDYDNINGKDIVQAHQHKTIFVLTHFDKLIEDGQESATIRLRKIIEKTKAPRFLIHGSQTDNADDEAKFFEKHRDVLDDFVGAGELECGVAALGKELEKKIADHFEMQIPIFRKTLESLLESVRVKIEKHEVKAPMSQLMEALGCVEKKFDKCVSVDFLRKQRELWCFRMNTVHLRCLEKEGEPLLVVLNKVKQMETFVWVQDEDEKWIASVFEGTATVDGKTVAVTRDETGQKRTSAIVYEMDHSPMSILEDIHLVAVKYQGLRNLLLVDPQKVLEPYAADFAKQYEPHFRAFVKNVASHVEEAIINAFDDDEVKARPNARAAIEAIRKVAMEMLEKHHQVAKQCVERIVAYNRAPLVFSTNDHYFLSIYQSLIAEAKEPDLVGDKLLMYKIKAYLKVQRKVIEEVGAKDVIGAFHRDFQLELKAFLTSLQTLEEYSKKMGDTSERERMYLVSLKRKKENLELCLKKLRGSDDGMDNI